MLSNQTFFSIVLLSAFSVAASGLVGCSNKLETQQVEPSSDLSASASPVSEPAAMMHHDMGSMDLGPKDEYFDLRFIDAMIPHHQGAIAMAEAVLENSNREEVKQLANAIIAAQQQEIDQMKAWRQAWYPDAGSTPMMYHAEMNHMMPMTPEMQAAMMMNVDLGSADDEFDLRFLNAMIPHHEGALVMAQQALEKSDRPELQALAQSILASQQQEIDQMQEWRKEWYGQ